MENLKIQILANKNSQTIEDCLKSVVPLDGEIVVIDFDSDEATIEVCEDYGAKIHKATSERDFSKTRNSLLGKQWNLVIEPYEILVSGHEEIKSLNPASYYGRVIQDDLITKDVRLWYGDQKKFQNPVYESVPSEGSNYCNSLMIYSRGDNLDPWIRRSILNEWIEKEAANPEPIYYSACWNLSQRNIEDFLKDSERYLFYKPGGMTEAMTLYYTAIVTMHQKDLQKAIRNIMRCIATNCLMAEFWCLLGDIYGRRNVYEKALEFYKNAIILGSKRQKADLWPIEVSKYQKYPEAMMQSCQGIIEQSVIYRSGAR